MDKEKTQLIRDKFIKYYKEHGVDEKLSTKLQDLALSDCDVWGDNTGLKIVHDLPFVKNYEVYFTSLHAVFNIYQEHIGGHPISPDRKMLLKYMDKWKEKLIANGTFENYVASFVCACNWSIRYKEYDIEDLIVFISKLKSPFKEDSLRILLKHPNYHHKDTHGNLTSTNLSAKNLVAILKNLEDITDEELNKIIYNLNNANDNFLYQAIVQLNESMEDDYPEKQNLICKMINFLPIHTEPISTIIDIAKLNFPNNFTNIKRLLAKRIINCANDSYEMHKNTTAFNGLVNAINEIVWLTDEDITRILQVLVNQYFDNEFKNKIADFKNRCLNRLNEDHIKILDDRIKEYNNYKKEEAKRQQANNNLYDEKLDSILDTLADL